MKKLIPILLISLIALSCKKSRTLHFTGKVVNAVTGEGIGGIEMQLIETRGADLQDPFQTNLDAVEIIQSDANGNFEIEYTGWNRYGYYILTNLNSQTHKMVGWQGGGDEIKTVELEEVNDNLEIVPFGVRFLKTKNINCIDENDSANFDITYLLTNMISDNNFYWTGCVDGQGVSSWSIGDYRYDWYVIRSGVRTDCTKVFTVHENDTALVELFY